MPESCRSGQAVTRDDPVVVEPHQRDHVLDVRVGLDPPRRRPLPPREDRVVRDPAGREELVPELLREHEVRRAVAVQMTDLAPAEPQRKLPARTWAGLDSLPRGDLLDDSFACRHLGPPSGRPPEGTPCEACCAIGNSSYDPGPSGRAACSAVASTTSTMRWWSSAASLPAAQTTSADGASKRWKTVSSLGRKVVRTYLTPVPSSAARRARSRASARAAAESARYDSTR